MKKAKLLLVLALFPFTFTFSQNEVDALRYSNITFGGTARYTAQAGAFGALGADFSALSVNPGGIGLYRRSEISFTPSIFASTVASTYEGTEMDDRKYNFNIANFGLVLTFDGDMLNIGNEWQAFQLGFGINRINNFNYNYLIKGHNPSTSLLTDYLANAQGKHPDDLGAYDTRLAFDTYLLDTLPGSTTDYFSVIPNGGVLQQKSISSRGSMTEFVISVGGNYNDRLYIGGTLGLPYLRYKERSKYQEFDDKDTLPDFNSLTLSDELTTTGAGVNFKFGIIYRLFDWVRLGAAVHTPTFFSLHDNYFRKMESELMPGFSYSSETPDGSFDYELVTPLRMIGSIAFIIGEYGLISGDYEFVDYSDARLHASSYSYFEANNDISEKYTYTNNFRIGTEWRLDPFAFRTGYALYGSPFKNDINDGEKTSITFGFGIREENYFIDFAYINTQMNEDYYLYLAPDPSFDPIVKNKFSSGTFLVTVGGKF